MGAMREGHNQFYYKDACSFHKRKRWLNESATVEGGWLVWSGSWWINKKKIYICIKKRKKSKINGEKKNVSPKPPSSTQNKDIDAHWYAENKRPCVLDVLQMNYYRLDFFICFVFFFFFFCCFLVHSQNVWLKPIPWSDRVEH